VQSFSFFVFLFLVEDVILSVTYAAMQNAVRTITFRTAVFVNSTFLDVNRISIA